MNISGIRGYEGLYTQTQPATSPKVEENLKPQEQPVTTSAGRPLEDFSSEPQNRSTSDGVKEFIDSYDPKAEYSLKGADSDINSLDEQNYVADSRKSQIYQQYRMFMGSVQGNANIQQVNQQREMMNFSI